MTNQEIFKVNVEDNIEAIAKCIQLEFNSMKPLPKLVEWCAKNTEMLSTVLFHNYNCAANEVTYSRKSEEQFDVIVDTVRELQLHK